MPCLVTLLGFFFPRVVMALLFLFTGWFGRAFETTLWPLLGFLFMPYTTLAYMIAMIYNGHQLTGGYIVLVVIGVVMDLGLHGDSGRKAAGQKRAA